VLLYYAIANAAALTLNRQEHPPVRLIPIVGLAGCLVLAVTLPGRSVIAGTAVVAVGACVYAVRRWLGTRS
jgi:APA family basic amino acid/polyamine antiporter